MRWSLWLGAGLSFGAGASGFPDGPLRDYAQRLDAQALEGEYEILYGSTEQDFDRTGAWAHLLRFSADVTGDGLDEYFVAQSGLDLATEWSAYSVADGQTRLLADGVWLRVGNIFREEQADGSVTLRAYERLPDRTWALVSYDFGPGGAVSEETRVLGAEEAEQLRRGGTNRVALGLSEPLIVEAEKIPASFYQKHPEAPWSKYDPNRSSMGQANEPTLEANRRWLEEQRSASVDGAASIASGRVAAREVVSRSPRSTSEVGTGGNSRASSGFGWLERVAVVLLAGAVVGLGWLFLRPKAVK